MWFRGQGSSSVDDFTTLVANIAVTVAELKVRVDRIERRVYENEKRQNADREAHAERGYFVPANAEYMEIDDVYAPYLAGGGDPWCG